MLTQWLINPVPEERLRIKRWSRSFIKIWLRGESSFSWVSLQKAATGSQI